MQGQANGVQWSSLVIGLLLVVISFIIFINPVANFYAIVWIIGFLAIVIGLLELVFRRVQKKYLGVSSKWLIALGLINIVFGLMVMFNVGVSSFFFMYYFAIWFILHAFMSFFTITPMVHRRNGFRLLSMLLNVIYIIMGIVLLFNPLLSAVMVSFVIAIAFFMNGLFYIVDAFSR